MAKTTTLEAPRKKSVTEALDGKYTIEGTLYAFTDIDIRIASCSSIEEAKGKYFEQLKHLCKGFPKGEYSANLIIDKNGEYFDSDEFVISIGEDTGTITVAY